MGIPRRPVLRATLLALIVALLAPSISLALVVDPTTSYTQPANALLMPFDATRGSDALLRVSNPSGVSPGGVAAVSTNWSFWSETGNHLADVIICLTLNDTVEVRPRHIQGLGLANEELGPIVDLSGQRGYVVVTAYATDGSCSDPVTSGLGLIDDAIVGSYSMISHGTRLGSNAIGLGLDATGSFTKLPAFDLSSVDLQTQAPSGLASSRVILMAVQEQRGSGFAAFLEVGPPASTFHADTESFDDQEIATSLPDLGIAAALFTSLKPAISNSLVPNTIIMTSPGLFRLANLRAGVTPVGSGTFLYAVHAQRKGKAELTVNGSYRKN